MEGSDNIIYKVILVGDSGVGKAFLIQRYVNINIQTIQNPLVHQHIHIKL